MAQESLTPICDSQAIYMKDAASHGEDMPDSVIDARIARQLERSNVALRLACEAIIYATDTGGAMDLIKNISIASQQARAALQGGK